MYGLNRSGNAGATAGDIIGVKRALAGDDPPVERKVFHRVRRVLPYVIVREEVMRVT